MPPLIPFTDYLIIKIATIVLGVLISCAGGFLCMARCEEKWITYRITLENLKREEVLYKTGCSPYCRNLSNRLEMFIQNIENLLSEEKSRWLKVVTEKTEKGQCSNG